MSTNMHLSHRSPDIADDYDVGNDDDGEWNHPESDKYDDGEWVSCRIIGEVIKAATCQIALR